MHGSSPRPRSADGLGFSLYPVDTVPTAHGTRPAMPEDSIALLRLVKGFLAKDNVPDSHPDLEHRGQLRPARRGNGRYAGGPDPGGPPGGLRDADLPAQRRSGGEAGLLVRLRHGQPPGRWARSATPCSPTRRTGLAGTLTPAGLAFPRSSPWMAGTLVGHARPRPLHRRQERHLHVPGPVRQGRRPGLLEPVLKTVKVTLVRSATKKVDEYGVTAKAKGGSRLKVDYRPVLVRSGTLVAEQGHVPLVPAHRPGGASRSSRTAVRRGVICALAWLARGLAGTVAPASATTYGSRTPCSGCTTAIGASFAAVHEGSVRLWDVGVQWQRHRDAPASLQLDQPRRPGRAAPRPPTPR